jgi:hypothetical protein
MRAGCFFFFFSFCEGWECCEVCGRSGAVRGVEAQVGAVAGDGAVPGPAALCNMEVTCYDQVDLLPITRWLKTRSAGAGLWADDRNLCIQSRMQVSEAQLLTNH